MEWRKPIHLQPSNSFVTAGAYSTHFQDAFSFKSNPACLGNQNKFFIAGLWLKKNGCLQPWIITRWLHPVDWEKGEWESVLQQSGDADFSEQGVGTGYGINTRGGWNWELVSGICRTKTAGYGAAGFISVRSRDPFPIDRKVNNRMGTGFAGIPGRQAKQTRKGAPQFFQMGFGYEYTGRFVHWHCKL